MVLRCLCFTNSIIVDECYFFVKIKLNFNDFIIIIDFIVMIKFDLFYLFNFIIKYFTNLIFDIDFH